MFLETIPGLDKIAFQAQLLNAIEQAVIVTDPSGRIGYWNRFAERLYGWTSKEALDQDIVDLLASSPFAGRAEEIMKRLQLEKRWTGEFLVRRKDGTEFPVEIVYLPLYGDDTRLIGIVGVSKDVSDRSRTRNELCERKDNYRTLVEKPSDRIHTYDGTGQFLDTNTKVSGMLGYSRDELPELNVTDLIPTADHLVSSPVELDEVPSATDLLNERAMPRKDGTFSYPEISGKIVPERVIHGIVSDVTERKTVEESLRQSEERLRTILESSNDGILVEENERIIFANKSYLDLFGYEDADALVGRHVSSVIAPADLERVLGYGKSRLSGFSAPTKYEFKGQKQNGIEFDVEASVSVSASNGSRLITTFITDIGDRKLLQVLMAAHKGALEMVVRGSPLVETLAHLTNVVEEQSGRSAVASVLLLDKEKRLRNGASPSLPDDYLRAIDGIKADINVGTCAAAAAAGKVVITHDIEADPKWNGLAHLPTALGFIAAWSMPIIARDGHVLGTFGTYFKERRGPTDLEKKVIEVLARTAALAIEQKQSEESLRESERQLNLIADAIPLLVSFVGSDRRYRFVNRAYTEWFGFSRAEIIGRHLSDVLGTQAYETILHHVETALAGTPCTFEGSVSYRTGKRFISAKYIPEVDPFSGDIVGFHAFVEDISARRKAEGILRRSKRELESLIRERTRELETVAGDRIEMLRQLVNAQEDERRRIAREVHDQLGQQMTVLRLKLAAIQKSSDPGDEIYRQIEEVRGLAGALDSDIGFLAWRSRPAVLDDIGLAAALDQYIQRWSAHVSITATFDGRRFGERRLDPEAETAFYRIMQEALNNVSKHAGARSVSVFLERKGLDAILIVEDDGAGFEPDKMPWAPSTTGLGLTSMRERMALIGGNLEIESSGAAGTTVYATVPDAFRDRSSR